VIERNRAAPGNRGGLFCFPSGSSFEPILHLEIGEILEVGGLAGNQHKNIHDSDAGDLAISAGHHLHIDRQVRPFQPKP
jgi:hypothetical protein